MGRKWDKEEYNRLESKKHSNHSKQKTIAGNTASLGGHVFYLGGSPNKSGCRYEKAVERLAEHVQSEFGSKMWSLHVHLSLLCFQQ